MDEDHATSLQPTAVECDSNSILSLGSQEFSNDCDLSQAEPESSNDIPSDQCLFFWEKVNMLGGGTVTLFERVAELVEPIMVNCA